MYDFCMSKLEAFSLIAFGFLIFEIVFIRIGLFAGVPVTSLTLILSFVIYSAALAFIISSTSQKFAPLVAFIGLNLFLAGVAFLLGFTFDTSWDGQGYHQTAVIALSQGWNPVWHSAIDFSQKLPSQIFAEGYPSALWEVEASVYSFFDKVNSAKIVNIYIAIVAFTVTYSLLRKLSFGKILAGFSSLLVVFQPVYIIQLLTFMQDGFGYEVLVITAASLIIVAFAHRALFAIPMFIFGELILISTKYSNLPIALALGAIFFLIVGNRFLNHEYIFNKQTKLFIVGIVFLGVIFTYLPYARNAISYKAMFYPTNIPELMGSVTYNNVPNNLRKENKFSLLFYGIFSRAQSKESGDPRSKTNIAQLKFPFTFSLLEIEDEAGLFNNRVGAGGPLFSGIVVLTLLFLLVMAFKTKDYKQRYALYSATFCLGFVCILALFAPTPNLLRYVNQLQLLPFIVIVATYAVFKSKSVKAFTVLVLALIFLNTTLYASGVFVKTYDESQKMSEQFNQMRSSGKTYEVGAQQFYSNYILLTEQQVPFVVSDYLECNKNMKALVASSNTTHYCPESNELQKLSFTDL